MENVNAQQKQETLPLWGKCVLIALIPLAIILLIWEPGWQTASLHREYAVQQRQLRRNIGVFPPASSLISQQDIFTDQDRARQTLATIIGGVVVGLGAWFTWRSVKAAERTAEVAEKNAVFARKKADYDSALAKENLQLLREKGESDAALGLRKLNSDRYATAVGMLSEQGEHNLATRLGGIYLLESLARDSKEYYKSVLDVLSAYVRGIRPIKGADGEILQYSQMPADIQAIISVIGRINTNQPDFSGKDITDLSSSNLCGAPVAEANFCGVDFAKSDLQNCFFVDTDLRGSYFYGASFFGTLFDNAKIDEAYFYLEGQKSRHPLTQAKIDAAIGIPAELPPGINPPPLRGFGEGIS